MSISGLTAFMFQARLEDDAQCLLVIIRATPEGKKELVGLTDGVRESTRSWNELLLDQTEPSRGGILSGSNEAGTSPGFIGDENSGDPSRRDRRHSFRTGSPGISISNAASLQASAISRNPFRCSSDLARAAQRIHSRAY
jgi:hypothetical protein